MEPPPSADPSTTLPAGSTDAKPSVDPPSYPSAPKRSGESGWRHHPREIERRRLEEELAWEMHANKAYEHYRATGRMKDGRCLGAPPKPYTPPATPQGKVNLTDLEGS